MHFKILGLKGNTSFMISNLNYILKRVYNYLEVLYHIQAIALKDSADHC